MMKGMIRMEENEDNIVYLNPYTREELLKMRQEAGCSDDPGIPRRRSSAG